MHFPENAKEILLEKIDRVVDGIGIREVIFALDRPLPPGPMDIPPWPRLITVTEGCKNMLIAGRNGVQTVSVFPGTVVFPVIHGWSGMIMDTDQNFLSMVYRESCTRCISAYKPAGDATPDLDYVYHTGSRLTGAGEHVLQALQDIAQQKDTKTAVPLTEALLRLTRQQLQEDAPYAGDRSYHTYRMILEYLQENYHRNIGRQEAADELKLNPSYVSQLFSRYCDAGFNEYLTGIRLSKAAFLLKSSALPIDQIACQCGFTSPGYFIGLFKKQYGQTPGRYRL